MSILNHAQLTRLLAHKEPAVRGELHGRGIRQSTRHQRLLEAGRLGRRVGGNGDRGEQHEQNSYLGAPNAVSRHGWRSCL